MEPMSAPPAPAPADYQGPLTATPPPAPRVADAVLAELSGGEPSSCPEVLLFGTMTRGTLDSAHRALDELEHRLAHVLRDVQPSPPLDQHLPRQPETALGQRELDTYQGVSALESRIHSLRSRLEV